MRERRERMCVCKKKLRVEGCKDGVRMKLKEREWEK